MQIHPDVTEAAVLAAAEAQMYGCDNPGFCIACGCEADGCEPDARNYECDACGEASVYGAEELLLQGLFV